MHARHMEHLVTISRNEVPQIEKEAMRINLQLGVSYHKRLELDERQLKQFFSLTALTPTCAASKNDSSDACIGRLVDHSNM